MFLNAMATNGAKLFCKQNLANDKLLMEILQYAETFLHLHTYKVLVVGRHKPLEGPASLGNKRQEIMAKSDVILIVIKAFFIVALRHISRVTTD